MLNTYLAVKLWQSQGLAGLPYYGVPAMHTYLEYLLPCPSISMPKFCLQINHSKIFEHKCLYNAYYLVDSLQEEIFSLGKGAFTNYVYKRRGVGGQKKSTFCKLLYHRKCKWRGIGGQKKTNLVNVVCECPLRLDTWSKNTFSESSLGGCP